MDEKNIPTYDRRRAIKAIGAIGTGLVGVGSLPSIGSANPTVCSIQPEDGLTTQCGGGGGTGPGAVRAGLQADINFDEIIDNVSPGEACKKMVEGCLVYTAAAAVDLVPGDEFALAIACGVGGVGCAVYNAFKDEHGTQNADVFRIREDAGDMNSGEYVMVPSDWGWHA